MAKKCLVTCDHCGSTNEDPKNQGDYKGIREGVSVKITRAVVCTSFGPCDLCAECCEKFRRCIHLYFGAAEAEAS
jgi:hypothetical protein